jgi:hypothetical protein
MLTLLTGLAPFSFAAEDPLSPEEFSDKEKEALRKAVKPQKQLKVYLDVVFNRLKQFQVLVQKCEQNLAQRYLKGYELALNRADDLASKEDPSEKQARKLLKTLLKATQKINDSLIETLEKVPQDCRPLVQLALEVSQQVYSAVEVQLLRAADL